jgi:hypothetical protein
MMLRLIPFIVALAAACAASSAARAQKDGNEKQDRATEIKATRAILQEAEHRLARLRELDKKVAGVVAVMEFVEAELSVAETKIHLAVLENKTATILEQLSIARELRKRAKEVFEKLAAIGTVSVQEVDEATIQLARVQCLEGLFTIVALREKAVARIEMVAQKGGAAKAEVEQVRREFAESQRLAEKIYRELRGKTGMDNDKK